MFIRASLARGSVSVRAGRYGRVPLGPTVQTYRFATRRLRCTENYALTEGEFCMRALLVMVIVFFIATFPATWLLMLFLGNTGLALSYWGTLPLGILVSVLLSGAAASVP